MTTAQGAVACLPRCFRAGAGPRARVPWAGRHFAGGLAGHALSPPTFQQPFRPTRTGCQGIIAASGEWCDGGGRTGVFCRADRVFSRLTHRIWGTTHPCPPGEGSRPRVWSVWGLTSFSLSFWAAVSAGGGFSSFTTNIFPLPIVSARGEGSGSFLYF
jgi:hypothetical protein